MTPERRRKLARLSSRIKRSTHLWLTTPGGNKRRRALEGAPQGCPMADPC
jgi:hypothetical protein